jgi:hypothetical protein
MLQQQLPHDAVVAAAAAAAVVAAAAVTVAGLRHSLCSGRTLKGKRTWQQASCSCSGKAAKSLSTMLCIQLRWVCCLSHVMSHLLLFVMAAGIMQLQRQGCKVIENGVVYATVASAWHAIFYMMCMPPLHRHGMRSFT